MKTIIKYILAAPLMLCLSSCLDEHPKDQLDQEAIYNNADNIYKNAVASLYNLSAATRSRKDFKELAGVFTTTIP